MANKNEEPRRNASGVLVEQRIMDGLTKFFKYSEESEANDYAHNKNSYVDKCYIDRNLVGFTVPK